MLSYRMPSAKDAKIEMLMICFLAAAGAALVLAVLVLASVPPVDRDALTHHLAVPKLYLKQGGIHELPHVPFSYYPMNLDLLYLIPLYFGNDIAPKYIHFTFALFSAGLIFFYLRRKLDRLSYALLGALLFLSLPVIIKLSVTVYVDLGLICFSTAGMLQLLRWSETNFRLRHLLLAAIFGGLCLGTKPNGMLAVFLLGLTVPFLYRRAAAGRAAPLRELSLRDVSGRRTAKSLGWTLLFTAVALAVFSPWMIRNFSWTGNPVFPLAQNLFGTPSPADNDPEAASGEDLGGSGSGEAQFQGGNGMGHFAVRKLIFGESLLEILAIPVRIFIQGQDDNPRLFDGRLNPYLLVFPLLGVFVLPGRRKPLHLQLEIRVMQLFCLLYLIFALFLVDMRIRYIGPILPPLVILAVFGLHDLAGIIRRQFSSWGRSLAWGAVGAVLLVLMGLNAGYLVAQFGLIDPMSYLQGSLTRDEYIQRYRPEYGAISFANRHLPEEARILSLFNGNRIYYSDRDMISGNDVFRQAVRASQSPAELIQRLQRSGVSHLLVRMDLFNHWADRQFKAAEKSLLQSFFGEKLLRLYQGQGYALFDMTRG
jgi:4-amino-4-deoxy-L-arabinose transferase-like glycosyltransferase